mgnify:CR=1 FL=1
MNKFKITIDENNFDVTVNITDHDKATVEVNGISYDVTYESKNTVAPAVTRKPAAIPRVPHKLQLPTRRTQLRLRFPVPYPQLTLKLAAK